MFEQAPYEFETAVATSITLAVAAAALPLVHWEMEGDRDVRRSLMLLITALAGVGVVAAPALRFLYSYVSDEEKLKNRCVLHCCCCFQRARRSLKSDVRAVVSDYGSKCDSASVVWDYGRKCYSALSA